jgi:hypothetical protein
VAEHHFTSNYNNNIASFEVVDELDVDASIHDDTNVESSTLLM